MTRLLHIALLISSAYAAASACENGALEIVKGTRCRRYAECENGSWHLKECKFGQVFDSKKLKCALGRCVDRSKCPEGRAYSHLDNANLYYRCINGRISIQVCGAGEVFDPDLQYCRFDDAFQHRGLSRARRDADEACEDGSKRRDGKSCKDYFECVKGEEVKKSCADCMNFDDTTQTCRFVFVSPCKYAPTPEPPTTPTDPPTPPTDPPTPPTDPPTPPTDPPTPPTDPPTPPTDPPTPPTDPPTPPTDPPTPPTDPPTPPTDPPKPTDPPTPPTDPPTPSTEPTPCKEGDKIGVVDPDCKAYKVCKNGVWVNDACGWWRKFDAIKKECEYSWFHKITCAS